MKRKCLCCCETQYHAALAHILWPFDRVPDDQLHELKDGVGVERRRPRVELIQNAAQRPEVSCVVVGFLFHQLRRHVQRSPLNGGQHQCGDTHGPSKSGRRLRWEMYWTFGFIRPARNLVKWVLNPELFFHLILKGRKALEKKIQGFLFTGNVTKKIQ